MGFKHYENWDEVKPITIEHSILAKYKASTNPYIQEAVELWLREVEYDFAYIQYDIYEPSFTKSIDEHRLAEMELRELDKFFETGKCNSMAVQYKPLNGSYTEQEIYDYYLKLLRGRFDFFISEQEFLEYEDKNMHFALAMGDYIDKLKYYLENTEETNQKEPTKPDLEEPSLRKEWGLAVRVQSLLWLRDYLQDLLKSDNFSKLNLPKPSMDDLVTKQGFQVAKSEITPALYKELVEHGLIKDEGLARFKATFLNGEGSIEWLGGATHGIGVNSLIYLIDKMHVEKIIKDENFIKKASLLFKDKNQKNFKHSSLNQSNGANKNIPPKNKPILIGIVNYLKNL